MRLRHRVQQVAAELAGQLGVAADQRTQVERVREHAVVHREVVPQDDGMAVEAGAARARLRAGERGREDAGPGPADRQARGAAPAASAAWYGRQVVPA